MDVPVVCLVQLVFPIRNMTKYIWLTVKMGVLIMLRITPFTYIPDLCLSFPLRWGPDIHYRHRLDPQGENLVQFPAENSILLELFFFSEHISPRLILTMYFILYVMKELNRNQTDESISDELD